MRLFSYRNRPVHMGPLPVESLKRSDAADLSAVSTWDQLIYQQPDRPESIINAMRLYARYMDAARNGDVSAQTPDITSDPKERSEQMKAMAFFMDALDARCFDVTDSLLLPTPYINADLQQVHDEMGAWPPEAPPFHHHIAHGLQHSIDSNTEGVDHHTHGICIAYNHFREVTSNEPGFGWLHGSGFHTACIRANETAVVIAAYIRALGFDAIAHSASTSNIDLAKAALACGIAESEANGKIQHPYLEKKFGLAVVTTNMELASDKPLAARTRVDQFKSHGLNWWLGYGSGSGMAAAKNRSSVDPYEKRGFDSDIYGMSRIKRQEKSTTLIDEERVPRLPKRSDMFFRGYFGDLGKNVQDNSVDEFCVIKTVTAEAQYHLIGALHLLERRESESPVQPGNDDPVLNAARIKSALHYIGTDMVGISAAPDWVWYSHELDGSELVPPHTNAITLLIDQGHETMEGASGDDWIASSQSMRAYLRGMFLGGIVAEQIRNLGYKAQTHSVVDSDVVHPPLVLLSGLGEASRIGDTVLNPFLGPRLKTLIVTTDMPLQADKPIDFGLQAFCSACKKCARECPSGAISAGPKLKFNGYETWKPDTEKCTRYRVTQDGGAMCGRCMKTCPWNLEGLFIESPFRWLAMNAPKAAPWLSKLDDSLGHGNINPIKKWWWDVETSIDGLKQAVPVERINVTELNTDLDLQYEDQTLACYPADMAPAPLPVAQPLDRELGIQRYQELLTPEQYKAKLAAGDTDNLVPEYQIPADTPDVQYLRIAKRTMSADDVVILELEKPGGGNLLPFEAGAHIDLVIDYPFTRQYSLAGDPAYQDKYVLGILNEPEGRGGSLRVHQRLFEGAVVPVTGPRNHFPLDLDAQKSLLIGGGIGITPLIAMGHSLHTENAKFEMHYCLRSRKSAGFLEELENVPWQSQVTLHISDEGTRADLAEILGSPETDTKVYACGPSHFMDAVLKVGDKLGWPEDTIRKEYFSAPDSEEYENHEFEVELAKSGTRFTVAAEDTLAEALAKNHVPVVTKCSDGICGVCSTRYLQGDVEHRDFVLTNSQRQENIIVCCSRARADGQRLVLDL